MLKQSKKLAFPTVLTGDFNSTKLNNAFKIANENLINCNINNDNSITFHLWGHPEILQNGITNIDYVFQTGGFKTKSYKVLNDIQDAEKLSDHYALVCELEL